LEAISIFVSVIVDFHGDGSHPGADSFQPIGFLLESASWFEVFLLVDDIALSVDNSPFFWISVWAVISCLDTVSNNVNRYREIVSNEPLTIKRSTELSQSSLGCVKWLFSLLVCFASFNVHEPCVDGVFLIKFEEVSSATQNDFVKLTFQGCEAFIV